MTLLAIDSSGLVASIAILQDETILAEYTVNYKKTHSQTLLPMIDEIVKMTETDLNSIDAIAIAGGPGSFTGLRIGSATAKGLGLALDKPIISVPTVEGLACNYIGFQGIICPIMDARRNQVYSGIYKSTSEELVVLHEQCAAEIEEIIDQLNQYNESVVFLGDGVPTYSSIIEKNTQVPYQFAPLHMNRQRAASIAYRAAQYFEEGRIQTAVEHQPEYLRLSQAERELAQKMEQKHIEGEQVLC